MRNGACPLWVISGHVQRNSVCPLCANSGHEVVHSTTLSARASNVGTVSAARFRGFGLIANSYFFGAGPGKSLGFSPAVNRLPNLSNQNRKPIYIHFLQLLSAKGVTTREVSRFQAGHEPTRTLCRRAMRKRVRHNITLRLSLQSIVANS